LIRFWQNNCFKIKIKKPGRKYFSFINFENPLYFWVRKGGLGGSTFRNLSDLKFMFLETLWYREWDKGDF
jgi:hypothetical protein